MIHIDHIFIFVSSKQDANELIEFGLTEGSGNIHLGIGTANRRFFFENFYLEILWVENETEAKNSQELGIWSRSDYSNNNFSRFGLCLKNTKDTDKIFKKSIQWEPLFLPKGMHVDILTSDNMPWVFRFPQNRSKDLQVEPKVHKLKTKQLSKAIFNLTEKEFQNTLNFIEDNSILQFQKSMSNSLVLEFDSLHKGKTTKFEKLNLEIRY